MKNFLLSLVFGIFTIFSISSCTVATTAIIPTEDGSYVEVQSDIIDYRNIDFNIIISNGIPYYYNGRLLYYRYNNLYYYPYYYDNYWYVRVYNRPIDYLRYRPYFRPNRHDYRFKPGIHPGYSQPPRRHNPNMRPNNPRRDVSPRMNNHKPNVGVPRTPQSTNRHSGSRHDNHNNRFRNRR